MLCERCHKREATMHVVCVVNNKQIDKWLCAQCAQELAPDNVIDVNSDSMKAFLEDLIKPFAHKLVSAQPVDGLLSEQHYTQDANRVLTAARRYAKQRRQERIATEHILLALLNENCYAAKLLAALKINKDMVRVELSSWMGGNGESEEPAGLSPKAKEAMRLARDFAQKDLLSQVSTAHILLGLVAAEEGVAARVLAHFDLTWSKLQNQMHEDFIASKELPEGNKFQAQMEAEMAQEKMKRALEALQGFGRNLNELARQGKLDPVVGRAKEIGHAARVLSRRTKNNPVLIGEAGVGKTAVAEGLAQMIVAKKVPEFLQDKTVFSMELGSILGGSKYRGELEERLQEIIEAVRDCPQMILFIDEMQMLMNGGDGTVSMGNLLKPSLARGELHVIGATTVADYRKSIEKDAALERRFQPILIKAPSVAETLTILKTLRPRYEDYHQVEIKDEALQAAVELADRYISDRNLPDKAIDLLDEACAEIRLHSVKDYSGQMGKPQVERCTIEKMISEWTNIPLERLTMAESRQLMHLEEQLHQRVMGQETAVGVVARAMRRARAGLKDVNRPVGSFLFLGPTGVGKTELAKALAENLFGDERALVRFDMSEYMEKHTVSRLIGAPPGYVGYDEGGQLTSVIRRRPYAVILLDEIEKAHPDVFNILLQIMEDGRLTDGQGNTVDFRNTVLIMTSNASAEKLAGGKALGFAASDTEQEQNKKQAVLEDIKQVFRPEFLNRVDEVIVFDTLGKKELAQIVDKLLAEMQVRLADMGLHLKASTEAKAKLLAVGMDVRYGARPLRRALRKNVEDKLADLYLSGVFGRGDTVNLDVVGGEFAFTHVENTPENVCVPLGEEVVHGQS